MLKAYIVSVINDPDQGSELVFAETAGKAKNSARELEPDFFTDLRAVRFPDFDDMATAPMRELDLAKWKAGWFYGIFDEPMYGTETEEEFLAWYDEQGFENEHRTWLECLKGTHTNS